MSAPVSLPRSASWAELAVGAPRLVRRRLALRVVVAVLIVPGAFLLFNLVRYGVTHVAPGFLLLTALHLLALTAALVPRGGDDPSAPILDRLVALEPRLATRHDRLRLLCRVLVAEAAALFVLPIVMTVLAGSKLQWGAGFTLAVAMLLVVAPMERLAAVERRERRRLVERTLRGP